MLRGILSAILLVPMSACSVPGPGPSGFGATERIGNLQVGNLEAEVAKSVPCSLAREQGFISASFSQTGPSLFRGNSFRYNEKWANRDYGITIEMIGLAHSGGDKHPDGSMWIKSILVYSGDLGFATARGIRIGSSELEVTQAYGKEFNVTESQPGTFFVAGSQESGLTFGFENGRVNAIVLRAGVH